MATKTKAAATKEIKRNIEEELVDYIDKRLLKNGLAQDAMARGDARALMVQAGSALVGIREATGRNDGKMVKLLQETIGGSSGESWCMSMIQSLIAYAEVKTGKKSRIAAGELCTAVWANSPKDLRVKIRPLAGAIVIYQDYKKGKPQITGHTEMVLSSDGGTMQTIGGNTSGSTKPADPVRANGNGVFYGVRSTKDTASRKIVGYLIPFDKEKA